MSKNWFSGTPVDNPEGMARDWLVSRIAQHNNVYNEKNKGAIEEAEKKPKSKPKPVKVDKTRVEQEIAVREAVSEEDPDNGRMASYRNTPHGYLKVEEQPKWLQKLARKSSSKSDFIAKFYQAMGRTEPVTESHEKWAGFLYDYLMGADEDKTVFIHSGTGNVIRFDKGTVSYKYLNDLNQYMNMEALVSGKEDAVRIIDIVPEGTVAFGHIMGERTKEDGTRVKISGLVNETENGIHMVLLNSLHNAWVQDTRVGHEDEIIPDLARVFFHEAGHAYGRERLDQTKVDASPAYKEYLDNFYRDNSLKGAVSKKFDNDGPGGEEAFAELYYDHIMSLYSDTAPVSKDFAKFLKKHENNTATFTGRPASTGELMEESDFKPLTPDELNQVFSPDNLGSGEEVSRDNFKRDTLRELQAKLVSYNEPKYFKDYFQKFSIDSKLKMLTSDRIASRMTSDPLKSLLATAFSIVFPVPQASALTSRIDMNDIPKIIAETKRGELKIDSLLLISNTEGLFVGKVSDLYSQIPKNSSSEEIQKYIDEVDQGGKTYSPGGVLHPEFKVLYSDTPEQNAHLMRYQAANHLVRQWAASSNDSNLVSLSLQKVAAKHFGIKNAAGWHTGKYSNGFGSWEGISSEDDFIKQHGDALEDFISAQYASTQDALDKANIKELVLYRGTNEVSFEVENPSKDDVNKVIQTKVIQRPMSSWSTSYSVAKGFAGYKNGGATIFKTVIKKEDIIGMPGTGVGCYDEDEAVALYNDTDRNAVAVVVDTSKDYSPYLFTDENRKDLQYAINHKNSGLFSKPETTKVDDYDELGTAVTTIGSFEYNGKTFPYKATYFKNDFSDSRTFKKLFGFDVQNNPRSFSNLEVFSSENPSNLIFKLRLDTPHRDRIENADSQKDISVLGGPLALYPVLEDFNTTYQLPAEARRDVRNSFIKELIDVAKPKDPQIFVEGTSMKTNPIADPETALNDLHTYKFPKDISSDSSGLNVGSNLMEEPVVPEANVDSNMENSDWIKTTGWDLPTKATDLANMFKDSAEFDHFMTLPAAQAAPPGLLNQTKKELQDRDSNVSAAGDFLLGVRESSSGHPERLYTEGKFRTQDGTTWDGKGWHDSIIEDDNYKKDVLGKFTFTGYDRGTNKTRVISVTAKKYNWGTNPNNDWFFGPGYLDSTDSSDTPDKEVQDELKKSVMDYLASHPNNIKVAMSKADVQLPGNFDSYLAKTRKFETLAEDNIPDHLADHLHELEARASEALDEYLISSTGSNFNFGPRTGAMRQDIKDRMLNSLVSLSGFQKYLTSKYNLQNVKGHEDTKLTSEELNITQQDMDLITHAHPQNEYGNVEKGLISKKRRENALNNMLEAINTPTRVIPGMSDKWSAVESPAKKALTPELEKALTDWYTADDKEYENQLFDYNRNVFINATKDNYPHIDYYMKHMQALDPINITVGRKKAIKLPGGDAYRHENGTTLVVPKMVANQHWLESDKPSIYSTVNEEGIKRHLDALDYIFDKAPLIPGQKPIITIGNSKLESAQSHAETGWVHAYALSPNITHIADKTENFETRTDGRNHNLTGWPAEQFNDMNTDNGELAIILAHEMGHFLHQNHIFDIQDQNSPGYKDDIAQVSDLMRKFPLSKYSNESMFEYLAEAWANYVMSKNGRGSHPELTDAILKKITEY